MSTTVTDIDLIRHGELSTTEYADDDFYADLDAAEGRLDELEADADSELERGETRRFP